MQRLPPDNVVFLPLDHVIVGMEYGVWRRSTLRLYLFDIQHYYFHGAQQRFSVTGDFGVINHRGGSFVCSSCHRSAVQVWGDMLTGGYVLNGLHPRLLSIRTYGALPGCFAGRTRCIAALESSVGAKEHSRGCNPRNTVNGPHPIEPRSGGQ